MQSSCGFVDTDIESVLKAHMDRLTGRPSEAVDECCSTASISLAKSEVLAKQSSLWRLKMAPSKQICEIHHHAHKKFQKKVTNLLHLYEPRVSG